MSLPPKWKAAIQAGNLWRGRSGTIGAVLPSTDGTSVLTGAPQGAQVHLILAGNDGRVVQDVGVIRRLAGTPGGFGFAAAHDGRIAFVFDLTNADDSSNVWNLYLWDSHSKQLTLVARNGAAPDGHPWQGGYIRPTLSAHYLYWVQAIKPLAGLDRSSALKQYNLATGRIRTLASGIIDQVVAFGSSVLYTSADVSATRRNPSFDREHLTALSATTGDPVSLPKGLTIARDEPGDVSTDGTTIVWESNEGLFAWRKQWGRSVHLLPTGPDGPMVAGNFVVFYYIRADAKKSGAYVFDLRSGSFARLGESTKGKVVANGIVVDLESYGDKKAAYDPAGALRSTDYVFDLADLPPLPACR